jgi:F-type H+-transporting ATPase subunit delta
VPRKFNARRYAQAVYEIALEKKDLERWRIDLQKIVDAVVNETFLAVLESPKIKFEDKSRLLERLGGIDPIVLNLVRLLIARGGVNMIPEIAAEYRLLLDEYHGIQTAAVVTAVPLDSEDQEKLATNLGARVEKKIVLDAAVDPEIIGGIIARVGGKLLDGSTRSKLIALKKELESGGRMGN